MLIRNLVSSQIEIPNEPGQWMQFRRLNTRRLAECGEKRHMDALNKMKALGADGLALIRDAVANRKEDDPKNEAPSNPLDAFDRDLLLRYGIAAWSYDANISTELESEDGGLDSLTSDWAATQILKFNGLLPDEWNAELGN